MDFFFTTETQSVTEKAEVLQQSCNARTTLM